MTEWQLIETAPKDKTRILGYTAERCNNCSPETSGMAICYWSAEDNRWAIGKMKTDGKLVFRTHAPTHWMPLPKAPE